MTHNDLYMVIKCTADSMELNMIANPGSSFCGLTPQSQIAQTLWNRKTNKESSKDNTSLTYLSSEVLAFLRTAKVSMRQSSVSLSWMLLSLLYSPSKKRQPFQFKSFIKCQTFSKSFKTTPRIQSDIFNRNIRRDHGKLQNSKIRLLGTKLWRSLMVTNQEKMI